jgi:manganese/zinc/iron transport system substrate-binding protein
MLRRDFHALIGRGLVATLAASSGVMSLPSVAQTASGKIGVVATTGMLADAVREVGGDRVDVTALMGVGVDPHTYRQTRSDVAKLTRADLVIWHGLQLEAQLEDLFKDIARRKPVVALAEAIPKERLLADATNPQIFDPHVWMDPQLWQPVVAAARDALVKVDAAGKASYDANADRYIKQVAALDARVKTALSAVPARSRVLVTAHDAFRYFGRANGYEVLGIQGISTESEASLHQIEKLVGILVERKIGAIFVESSVSDQNIRALVEGAAARGHKVAVGGELFSDAMGKPGTPEGTYLGMIDHNARTIARALGGDQ